MGNGVLSGGVLLGDPLVRARSGEEFASAGLPGGLEEHGQLRAGDHRGVASEDKQSVQDGGDGAVPGGEPFGPLPSGAAQRGEGRFAAGGPVLSVHRLEARGDLPAPDREAHEGHLVPVRAADHRTGGADPAESGVLPERAHLEKVSQPVPPPHAGRARTPARGRPVRPLSAAQVPLPALPQHSPRHQHHLSGHHQPNTQVSLHPPCLPPHHTATLHPPYHQDTLRCQPNHHRQVPITPHLMNTFTNIYITYQIYKLFIHLYHIFSIQSYYSYNQFNYFINIYLNITTM